MAYTHIFGCRSIFARRQGWDGCFPWSRLKPPRRCQQINMILYCFRDQRGCKSKKIPSALTSVWIKWPCSGPLMSPPRWCTLTRADSSSVQSAESCFPNFSVLHRILTSKENVVQKVLWSVAYERKNSTQYRSLLIHSRNNWQRGPWTKDLRLHTSAWKMTTERKPDDSDKGIDFFQQQTTVIESMKCVHWLQHMLTDYHPAKVDNYIHKDLKAYFFCTITSRAWVGMR